MRTTRREDLDKDKRKYREQKKKEIYKKGIEGERE